MESNVIFIWVWNYGSIDYTMKSALGISTKYVRDVFFKYFFFWELCEFGTSLNPIEIR